MDRNLLQLKTKAGIGVVIKVIVKKISQKTKIYESSAGNAGSHLRVNQGSMVVYTKQKVLFFSRTNYLRHRYRLLSFYSFLA